jgi:hypothetical protein
VALAINLITYAWVLPSRAMLTANLTVRGPVLVRCLEGFVNLGLSIFLGRIYGVIGVVLATGITCMATSMWILPMLTARMFERPFVRFVMDDAARALALHVAGFSGALAGGAITGACGAVLLWFLILDARLRLRVRGVVGQLMHVHS